MIKNKSFASFVTYLVKEYQIYLFCFVVIAIVVAGINVLLPYILKVIIDLVVDYYDNKDLISHAIEPDTIKYITLWVFLCLMLIMSDCTKLKLYLKLKQNISSSMFSHLTHHSYKFFQNNLSGSLINKIVDMQNSLIEVFDITNAVFTQFLIIAFAVVSLLLIHPVFSLILIGWVIVFILNTIYFFKPIRKLSHEFAEARSNMVGKMVDRISNILTVSLFSRHPFERSYIGREIDFAIQKDREMVVKIIWMRVFWNISIVALLSFDLWILVYLYSQNKITVGDFSFVITLSVSILWYLWNVSSQFVSFSEKLGICTQAYSIITAKHEIVDTPNEKSLNVTHGKVQFNNVNFHYDEHKKLFTNKSITIQGGEKVGLVGFSGSGKSTFVKLILRLYDVNSGTISIDDQNISQVLQERCSKKHLFLY